MPPCMSSNPPPPGASARPHPTRRAPTPAASAPHPYGGSQPRLRPSGLHPAQSSASGCIAQGGQASSGARLLLEGCVASGKSLLLSVLTRGQRGWEQSAQELREDGMLTFSAGCLEHGDTGNAHLQTPARCSRGLTPRLGEGAGRGQRSRGGHGPGVCSPCSGVLGTPCPQVVRRPHRASGSWVGVRWSGHLSLLQVQ